MTTLFLPRPGGRLAYDDTGGEGPLAVAVPGIGDLRSEYRELVPRLRAAGYRVVTLDLRGHGESDVTFTDLERTTAGADVIALLEHLGGGPAHLIGTSYGAAAVAWAAIVRPDLAVSLTLIGPFVRDVPVPAYMRLGMRLMLMRPWGARAWASWYAKLHPGHRPADLDEHRASIRRNLAQPGRLAALRAMARTSSREVEARLAEVTAPSLVVMGTADPDFPDPVEEARTIAALIDGQVELVDGAGHYPHVEQPDSTAEAITTFLTRTGLVG
jgi:pimeloyl-ACP methyl ester carboxylesterase